MRTSDPDIFALGECAESHGQVFGLVAPLYEMANVVAKQLLGDATAAFEPKATATKLKVTGIDLYSAGDFADAKTARISCCAIPRAVSTSASSSGEQSRGRRRHVWRNRRRAWFFDLIKRQADISAMRETLIFGQAYQGGSPLDPTAAVAALPDDAEICGCNGVCKGKIVAAINERA
jgi:nitrite reductase (NADH) large subunit